MPITTKMRPPSRLPKPTDEEAQYLTFFTNYCKNDFVTYRSKFPDDFDLIYQSKRGGIQIEAAFNDISSTREQEKETEERR